MKTKIKEMNRREFLKVTTTATVAAGMFTSFMLNSNMLYALTDNSVSDLEMMQKTIKKDFFKVACSGALFQYLNRHYGYPKDDESFAVASLSGGIMQKGYQCGMLWGSTLAVGAESYRRYKNSGKAIYGSINAAQHLMKSFSKRAKCIYCRDITGVEWSEKYSIPKYLLKGGVFICMNLAKKWAAEAVKSGEEGLSLDQTNYSQMPLSCASEVAKKMGASDEEIIMVSGLAGGMGLSGNACGALATAVLLKSLEWYKEHPESKNESKEMYNPYAKNSLDKFLNLTNSEMLCHKICGKQFKSVEAHTEFIKNNGCRKLIDTIAES
ncbi:C-GCAxxG-C-C family (seleno)protein [Bacteroidota bacterium]